MKEITVQSGKDIINVTATRDMSEYYSALSKNWSVKTDGTIDGIEYSSKYYANQAKESETKCLKELDETKNKIMSEFKSAFYEVLKKAEDWAEKTDGAVEGDEFSAKFYANKTEEISDSAIQTLDEIINSLPEKFAGFSLFDTKMTDHILGGDEAVGWALQGSLITNIYPDAVSKIIQEYKNGEDVIYREIQCKRALNGHYIVNFAQKEAVDSIFANSGIADFYILDFENQQFYLPKNNHFTQFTTDTAELNTYMEAGLPNIEGAIVLRQGNGDPIIEGAFRNCGVTGSNQVGPPVNTPYSNEFNASLSNPIYGKSETVQPPSSLKLLYYKVGNTIVNEEKIDTQELISDVDNLKNSKADINLSNTTGNVAQSFKNDSIGWGFPDYPKLVGKTSGTYTESVNGFIIANPTPNGFYSVEVLISGTKFIFGQGMTNSDYIHCSGIFFIPANTPYTLAVSGNGTTYFAPCAGSYAR